MQEEKQQEILQEGKQEENQEAKQEKKARRKTKRKTYKKGKTLDARTFNLMRIVCSSYEQKKKTVQKEICK